MKKINPSIGSYQITSDDNILILESDNGKALYDVSKGKQITPFLSSIEELKDAKGVIFDATAIVSTKEKGYGILTDYLFFRIDSKGSVVSPIISPYEKGPISLSSEFRSIENIIAARRVILLARELQLVSKIFNKKPEKSGLKLTF